MSLTIAPTGTNMASVMRRDSRSGRREITERLAARILGHIQSEDLGTGDHLAAQDLAARFGVSRTPVNQALGLLHAKGVLRHEQNRGYFVGEARDVTPDTIGLAEGDDITEAYFALADDHLRARIPAQASESHLRERYRLTRAQLTAVLGRAAEEGWAERRAGYGWGFSPVLSTQESLEQTYRVRLALEPAALLEPGYQLDVETAERLRAAGAASRRRHRDGQRGCAARARRALSRDHRRRLPQPVFRGDHPAHQPRPAALVLPVDARPHALSPALPRAFEDPRSNWAPEERRGRGGASPPSRGNDAQPAQDQGAA